MLGVVVLNYNDAETVEKNISKIRDYSVIDHIVIVDNSSTDNSYDRLKKLCSDRIDVVKTDRNGGYGYGNNFGIKYLIKNYNVDYIAITNPDVVYSEDALMKCASFLETHRTEKYAVCAPKMKNIHGKYVRSAWETPRLDDYLTGRLSFVGRRDRYKYIDIKPEFGFAECGCVAGSMLVINSKLFIEMGMYDENIFLYCEESVIGIKCQRNGFKSALLYDCFFVHAHSVSIDKSIASKCKQNTLLWKSRKYVLRAYYQVKGLWWLLIWSVQLLSMLEVMLRQAKHRVLKWGFFQNRKTR